MGGTSYSRAFYDDTMADHKAKGTSAFVHTAAISSGTAKAAVHESLNPSIPNKAGKRVRESFDSDAHPRSRAIAVLFDVTGSMNTLPQLFQKKLPNLMAMLTEKGYVQDPHVLFGAIGDATCDKAPIQIGQFEAGNEMDAALGNVYLEGNGGGQQTESYELSMYYMARHCDMDCVSKRSEKAYLFLTGDELPYSRVSKSQVKKFIGDDIQDDIPIDEILAELRERFEVFWIMPFGSSNFDDRKVVDPLRKMFGQHFLKLENADDICELICSTIGVNEGVDIEDVARDLKDIGADERATDRVTTALAVLSSNAVSKGTKGDVPAIAGASDSVSRL